MSVLDSLALKYRPKKLSDVIGQPIVVKAFTNAFKSKTLHHAYILSGVFGTGKTSVGRIIAAMENCKKGGFDPCGECSNCKAIFDGNSMEVKELDAGSEGKVDDIREIHKSLYQCPVECRTKYVIIDEAHALTGSAETASLKMIEEPPLHVRFILCTTDPQAFKPTIHSRCVSWHFNKVSWQEIFEHLKIVSQKEELSVDDRALVIAARNAKGSVRSSLQNLQAIINYCGNDRLTEEAAIEALGVVNESAYFDLFNAIFEGNMMEAFLFVDALFKGGKDAKAVMDGVYLHLNNLLIIKACASKVEKFDFTQEEIKRYSHQASKTKGNVILKIMSLVSDIAFDIEYSLNPVHSFNKFAIASIQVVKSVKV